MCIISDILWLTWFLCLYIKERSIFFRKWHPDIAHILQETLFSLIKRLFRDRDLYKNQVNSLSAGIFHKNTRLQLL